MEKYGALPEDIITIWADGDIHLLKSELDAPLSDEEWKLVRSIVQGASALNSASGLVPTEVKNLGAAIKVLDRDIALLDQEQERVAIQIAPGPQRIRGLAGTGKTVLLAMKAANIHLRYPDKKILFTFHTQSLYNQAKKLITKFYRIYSEVDPDWDILHIRHSWGGRSRQGVYSDLCARQGVRPLDFREAKSRSKAQEPFQICCEAALKHPIRPEYDFLLIDEAQDFPKEFFQILYKLSNEPHHIYWAYDELQSLSSLEIPKPEVLFGNDENGRPLVSLDGDDYPGGIEKDFVLHRSYRCPQPVLMLAHAIGLGLYNPRGPIQMLGDKESWKSIGYEVTNGEFQKGQQITIFRPPINSPNRIAEIYPAQELVQAIHFQDREEELDWIARSIQKDVVEEDVLPEQIIVISLDTQGARGLLMGIQKRLLDLNIPSTIPGLIDNTAAFAEPGQATLSTVYRAKGNEAYIVYILSFDSLYDYVEEIGNRNRAFTAITRSKAWVRITGAGKNMEKAKDETDKIMQNLPEFKFIFPDMNKIRRLDSENSRRRKAVASAKKSASEIIELDPEALAAALDPNTLQKLLEHINEAKREN